MEKVRLGDICVLHYGKSLTANKRINGNVPVYSSAGLIGYHNVPLVNNRGIIIGRKGTVGKVYKTDKPFYCIDTAFYILPDDDVYDFDYLYYCLKSLGLENLNEDSAVPGLNRETACSQLIYFPKIEIQKKIAKILLDIDLKIENNAKINDNLEKLLVFMYEDMKKNHTDWTNVTLEQFCNIFTGKKNANQYNENGLYKFFTCGEKVLRINSYIFDGPAIIISGNGSYTGRTLFYNGKFDLYQRTYACTLKPNIPNSYIYGLYIILKVALHKKINGGTHGSSIPYIVMNDIAKFEFKLNDELFKIFSIYAKNILTLIQQNNFESQKLSDIRNELLIKLINNDISISDIDL